VTGELASPSFRSVRRKALAKVVVIDDEESVCWAFEKFLTGEGHEVATAATAEEGLSLLEKDGADIVFLDVRLPKMDGLAALERIRELHPGIYVVVITAHGTMDTAIEAVRRGAFDYLTKPLELAQISGVISRILESRAHAGKVAELPAQSEPPRADLLVGNSPVMQEVYKKIGAVAPTDATVLIEGESGTGKELVARAIHSASERRDGLFVAVACGALPEMLLESELFGHVKGAFTGAVSDRPGKFQKADGGTLFLDEVGATSLSAQVRLLRFLQEHEFEQVGSTETQIVDTRVIAASNEPLAAKAEAGEFREDLYYRLNVVHFEIPPLRDRKEDIPLLVAYFLSQAPGEARVVSTAVMEALKACDWPGNVRELKNAVEHAAALSRTGPILPSHLPDHIQAGGAGLPDKLGRIAQEALEAAGEKAEVYDSLMALWEKPLLKHALAMHKGNQVATAAFLGISRSTLRKKIAQYGI
jgi:DNA-binding NtrC family response regulator